VHQAGDVIDTYLESPHDICSAPTRRLSALTPGWQPLGGGAAAGGGRAEPMNDTAARCSRYGCGPVQLGTDAALYERHLRSITTDPRRGRAGRFEAIARSVATIRSAGC
jgi:hypothetical protein